MIAFLLLSTLVHSGLIGTDPVENSWVCGATFPDVHLPAECTVAWPSWAMFILFFEAI